MKKYFLSEYSQLIDEFAWFRKGDVMIIARVARQLGRDYMADITNRKFQLINSKKASL